MAERIRITERVATLAELGDVDTATTDATLLVAAVHDTRDRTVWGGDRAITYWSRLPERVRAACYAGPRLADWWERATRMLGCYQPPAAEERREIARILAADDPEVFRVLRTQPEMICLRVRLAFQREA